jgi:hypothetical protein
MDYYNRIFKYLRPVVKAPENPYKEINVMGTIALGYFSAHGKFPEPKKLAELTFAYFNPPPGKHLGTFGFGIGDVKE